MTKGWTHTWSGVLRAGGVAALMVIALLVEKLRTVVAQCLAAPPATGRQP